jgi:hypothetical protein
VIDRLSPIVEQGSFDEALTYDLDEEIDVRLRGARAHRDVMETGDPVFHHSFPGLKSGLPAPHLRGLAGASKIAEQGLHYHTR